MKKITFKNYWSKKFYMIIPINISLIFIHNSTGGRWVGYFTLLNFGIIYQGNSKKF